MDCQASEKLTELGCIPTDPIAFVEKFYGIGLGFIGVLAILFIIFGGYSIMMSQGNPEGINRGRSYITYAILGLILAVMGYVFIQVVLGDILRVPGFG